MSSVTSGICKAAEFYTDVVETGASLAYNGIDAGFSCLEAMVSTAATGAEIGVKQTLWRSIKWSLGCNDYAKGVEAFKRKPPVPIPNGNGAVIYDMRPMSRRIGEFFGHTFNGACKAVATGTFGVLGGATGFGVVSNYMWDDKTLGTVGDFHKASRLLAQGVVQVSQILAAFGIEMAKATGRAIEYAGSAIYNNPETSFNVAGSGTVLYFSAKQIVKAGNAETKIRKAAHCSLAMLGLGAIACVPKMNPFKV